jgi:tetratricopeptide (TPR) repeat protein
MDKNKIIEAAAKLVAKGAYDKAIKEYRRLLEADPRDVRVLQKMGELFQKKNENEQAATYFTKVAETYSSDGFFLKAVALYKQVLKLDPTLLEINLRLAELHQQLQLISEATSYYQVVAQQYEKSGNTKGSLDTLKKIIELDPENVNSRIKLGEMYARGHMKAEAADEFKRAAEYLRRNGRTEEYQRVFDRLSALDASDTALAREVAQGYLAKGDPKRALAKLQQCFKADPTDEKTLELLAEAFTAIGQVSKTISVCKELAKIYTSQGRTAEANQIWAKIEQLDPRDPDLSSKRGGSRKSSLVQSSAPQTRGPAPSPEPQADRSSPGLHRPTPEQLSKLLKETDVYVKYGLHDKALEHLGTIFSTDPENLDAHEKAYQVYVGSGNQALAGEQLLNVLRLCTRLRALDRGQPYLNTILQTNPEHPEVPTFLAVLGRGDASRQSPPEVEAISDDAILVDAADEEILLPEPPANVLDLSSEDLALQASVGTDEIVDDEAFVPFQDEETSQRQSGAMAVLPTVIVEASELEVEHQVPVNYDLEEETGEWDSATPSVQAPSPAEPAEYDLQIDDADEPTPSNEGFEDAVDDAEAAGDDASSLIQAEEAATSLDETDSAAAECEEARFLIDQGLLDEAREILQTVLIAYPGYSAAQELLARVEECEVGPESATETASEDRQDAFDLAAELATEMGELENEETVEVDSGSDDFQYSVDEVFAEFKKGLERVVRPEDVDTHYDLGIAYKEMGLTEDAIAEFNLARHGCVGEKKEIDCLTMIALLQKAQGNAAGAIESYKRALMSEHAIGEMEKALEFELGDTWEELGNPGKALYHYARVAKLDAQYRDVASIVSRLSLTAKPESDPLPPKKNPGGRSGGGLHGSNGIQAKGDGSGRGVSDESPEKSRADAPGAGGKKRKASFL